MFTGLKKVKYPEDWAPFGPRYAIDTKKLTRGIFSLVYPKTGNKPTQIRNANLTAPLKELMQAYMAGQPMDTSDLTEDEMDWFKFVWAQAGLTKLKAKLPQATGSNKMTKTAGMNRLKVLVGQVQAGNDADSVIIEMQDLVKQLNIHGWIPKEQLIKLRQFMSGKE